jgi:membrane protein implicated in regulation of membrane protease activity
MENITWILWTILGVILIIAEVFTPGFVLLWFGVGALAAALASFLGAGLPFQFLVFIVLSTALTALSRTIFVNYFTRRDEPAGFKTGAATLPGKVGTVVTSSRGALNEGAVKVFGSTWTAYPAEGEPPLEAGDRVVVERLQGASIYVRRVDSQPDWRGRELTEGDNER